MKYKNYKNPYTQEDSIYSRNNMLDMSLRELISRKDEILAQTRVLGIPEDKELSGSENAVYVEAYTRDDGTEVKSHWRSKPKSLSNGLVEIKSSDLSDIRLKQNIKISKFKECLINFNNNQNINYKDAMQCMNIGLIGPENIEDNTNFRVLSQNDVSDLSKRMSYDIPENIKTVEYSADSTLAKSVKNSATFRNAVKAWASTPAEYRQDKIFLTLNDNENLARSILHATIFNPQVSNGYFTGYLYDVYDFRLQLFAVRNYDSRTGTFKRDKLKNILKIIKP